MKIALIQMRGDGIKDYISTEQRIEGQILQACKKDVDFIVLPECAYPAYLLGIDKAAMQEALSRTERVIARIAALSRQNHVYITIGIALEKEGKLYNAALTFNRQGDIINQSFKSNLWHFDESWFTAGKESSVFDTEFGKIGVMICADGRIPEIAAMLRSKGAQLIIDPVNLAAAAAKPELLSNQQYEFILQARARENGVYIAACDKCGVECNMATYLGRSFVVDPEGNIIAECSPDKEEIAICDVDLSKSRTVALRRPQLYIEMTKPTEELPVSEVQNSRYSINETSLFTMLVRYPHTTIKDYLNNAIKYIEGGEAVFADLIILPELHPSLLLSDSMIEDIRKIIQGGQIVAIAGFTKGLCGLRRRAVFINKRGIIGEIGATHCSDAENADEIKVISLTPACKIAAIFDWEADIPEITRTAMLKGADILLCYDDGSDEWRVKMLKTRAAENKMFVIQSVSSTKPDCCVIYNPDGGQICTTLRQTEHAAAGYINTALSKFKNIVPGTNIVTGRIPSFYKELIR